MITKTHLTHQDIKSFLAHSDAFVRRAAAEFFSSLPLDQEVADLVMKTIKDHGHQKNLWIISTLPHAPFSNEQYSELIELAKSDGEKTVASLHNVLTFAPVAFLEKNLETIRQLPHMDDAVIEQIEHKISLAAKTPSEVWEDLKKTSLENSEEFEASFDYDIVANQIDLLANASSPSNEELLDLLSEADTEGEWLEIFLVELLGKRRFAGAVPALVAILEDVDAEVLSDKVLEALALINAPETLELLSERYLECLDDEAFVRMQLIEAMTKLRLPEVKKTLKLVLSKEQDQANRTLAYVGLCQCFDAESVKAAIKAARSGDFDPEFESLRSSVVAFADMLGLTLEERPLWTKERQEQENLLEKRFQELLDGELDDLDDASPRPSQMFSEPFVRDTPKVGRNDECPCGSGKKYKNCCLTTLQ